MRPHLEIVTRYGDNIHIFDDSLARALLAKLCLPETVQPKIDQLVGMLYRQMITYVVAAEMPTREMAIVTRMDAGWRGQVVDPQAKAVVACVARAGIFPSQVCYGFLNEILDPAGVRQDHMMMNRTVDEAGHVNGARISGTKIGGPVDGATLFIPDPMGATGTTVDTVLDHYRREVGGVPARIVVMNLIVTPNCIQRLRLRHVTKPDGYPPVTLYAFRLDMGTSNHLIKNNPDYVPGDSPDLENGLNEHQYIIPGGGGFGEIMNNSFV